MKLYVTHMVDQTEEIIDVNDVDDNPVVAESDTINTNARASSSIFDENLRFEAANTGEQSEAEREVEGEEQGEGEGEREGEGEGQGKGEGEGEGQVEDEADSEAKSEELIGTDEDDNYGSDVNKELRDVREAARDFL
ncbi:conserved hypothetical protein [Ricinus communis]|uniref:Uncharacterized protein n=1 Tax=Ricinus communis TaxID=3988 RepID=B9RMJ2_RICCO|nr:conserved hypothetical protein [Ricinus communis]